jgi:hypothetical protein
MRSLALCVMFAAVPSLPTATLAQAASYTYFGTNQCSVPLSATLPRIGKTFQVTILGSWSNPSSWCNSYLFTSFQKRSAPASLAFLNGSCSTGCGELLIGAESVILADASGTVPFTIPNDPNLVGVTFYQQALRQANYWFNCVVHHGLSNAGMGTIGP